MPNMVNISIRKQKLIIYIVLILTTLAIFGKVNQYGFVNYDDPAYVTVNNQIQSGITFDGFCWAFSTKYFGLWNPLVWLSYMLDYQVHGLNPAGYHITSLVLHIFSTLLLFWLFCRMTGAVWKSAFVAVLFALHPLHVESVVWIAERKDVLSAFFWMLTLCFYVSYTEKQDTRRYMMALFSFALALMSKPMVVTLPVIMILLDYWPLNRFETQKGNLIWWQLKEKAPFFILSAILIIITLYTPDNKHSSAIVSSLGSVHVDGFVSANILSLGSRLANIPVSFISYIGKTFWPYDLSIFYPFSEHIPFWQVMISIILILAVSIAAIVMIRRLPYLFVGWFWYVITMVPVIGIFQVSLATPYSMADRYHYLPSIGIGVILAWGLASLFTAEKIRKYVVFPAVILLCIMMAVLTWQQCRYWNNDVELWNHALKVTSGNYLAHNNLGYALFTEGKTEESINHYNDALRIKPDYFFSYNNRGFAYIKLGQYQQAMDDYNKVISLKPDYSPAYVERANIYSMLDSDQQAMEDLNNAIRLAPDFALAYNNRGFINFKHKRYDLAMEDFNHAIRLNPNFAMSYNNRAIIFFEQGDKITGCLNAQKACKTGICDIYEMARAKGYCR